MELPAFHPNSTPTPDRWSGQMVYKGVNATINFVPYAALLMFAVFKYEGDNCQTLYDGSDECMAVSIFNQHCST